MIAKGLQARRRAGLSGAIAAAVALHLAGAIAAWSSTDGPWRAPGAQSVNPSDAAPHAQASRPMALRVASLPARSTRAELEAVPATPQEPEPIALSPSPPDSPTHPAPQPEVQAEASADTERPGQGGLDAYLSRAAVDTGPQALSPIQVPYPEGETPLDAGPSGLVGRLTLFIDEHGAVRRVQVHGQSLPPPFEAAARNAFLQARFAPAQKQGQAVRVRIDIEVRFDDQPLIATPGAAGETRT